MEQRRIWHVHLSEHWLLRNVISIKLMCTGPYNHVVKRNTVFILHITYMYSKTCLKPPLLKRPKIGFGFQDQLSLNAGQKYCRMLQGEHSAILVTSLKLPFVIKIFVLSIYEWPFYTGFTVLQKGSAVAQW